MPKHTSVIGIIYKEKVLTSVIQHYAAHFEIKPIHIY